ncbi:uncharacterized protein N7484_010456 [Penicillium longicatenatum]|uniref:uncharacterized protein n=1 Tax=Penicillium longicatenatum TaxID=1561947 RepID=UPI002547A0BD|nr:uncharacterized protein N7484_010456 [Penicillium longicatenatum]KAJ5630356.1 hypothetical protein N7484_010456 [Penicillium longicatenatum]
MLEIHEATPADAQDLAEVFFAAFSDPFNRTMFPPTAEVKGWIADTFFNAKGLASEHEVTLTATDDNGKPVVFAKWVRPYHAAADLDLQSHDAVGGWPVGSDKDLCESFFETMSDHHHKLMGDRPHYYLELLGVHPSYQGKGLASKLLKWGLARADEEGVEVYLSSSPDGKFVYEKNGFKSYESFSPFPGYEQLDMVRPAQQ